jgi:chromosome segregation ATPase
MFEQATQGTGQDPRAAVQGGSFRSRLNARRKELVDAEYRLQAMETQAQALSDELRALGTFSVTSILSGIRGDRQHRIDTTREALAELQAACDQAAASIDAMRAELEELSARAEADSAAQQAREAELTARLKAREAAGDETARRLLALAGECQVVEAYGRGLEKAARACEEALRDLRDEMSTISTMGRCRMAEGNKALSAMMNHARKGVAGESAGRVRQALRRLCHRLQEAVDAAPPGLAPAFGEVRQVLEAAAEQFSGAGLGRSSTGAGSAEELHVTLQQADLLLDKSKTEAKARMSAIEQERRSLAEAP